MTKCRLCGAQSSDILKHLAIAHRLENVDQYNAAVQTRETEENKVAAFRSHVAELKKKRAEGIISAEEYRAAISDSNEG